MYLALYRQWRPSVFSDLIGQEAIVTTLLNQIKAGHIAHAYLFCGSRGTGKTSTAKVMARAINCVSPGDKKPCGECPVCKMGEEGSIDMVEMDAASNNGVDEIRDLREKVKYPPSVGKYRVYIIDEVHMLSAGAFNALLKTLEEPPPYIVFILATTEVQKLPATILSRCQRFDFKRISAKTIAERLGEIAESAGASADPAAVMAIAREAQGGMRDAISLLDVCLAYGDGNITLETVNRVLGASSREFIEGFVLAISEKNAQRAISDIDRLMRDGHEPGVFIRDVTKHLRALALSKICTDIADLLEISGDDAAAYARQAANIEIETLMRYIDLFLAAENDMRWVSTPRLALEMAVMKACHPKIDNNASLQERIKTLEDALEDVKKNAVSVRFSDVGESPSDVRDNPTESRNSIVDADKKARDTLSKESVITATINDDEIWQKGLKAAKALDGKFITFLMNCSFGGIEDDVLTINFKKTDDVYVKVLEAPERMDKLRNSFTEVAGRPIDVRLAFEEKTRKRTPDSENGGNLAKVIDLFGRENVEIKDD